MKSPDSSRARRYTLLALTAAMATSITACADVGRGSTAPTASADRQAQVAERGQSVMPFELDRTTHHFQKGNGGGVQTVVADDPRDVKQVDLVRRHLQQEAERFRRGDFTDPASIHGGQMPGLDVLRDSASRLEIEYGTTDDGARITYTSSDTTVVAALHAWFDAQVSDHGAHATSGATTSTS
ncbi:hypothetical protein [Micromonospora sp. NPDC051006]|uniref:hypothetical protein n=1 Tax=Micromonospora sp. NPDC051006 TaxID=3364283 RepID=UPI0037BD7B8C